MISIKENEQKLEAKRLSKEKAEAELKKEQMEAIKIKEARLKAVEEKKKAIAYKQAEEAEYIKEEKLSEMRLQEAEAQRQTQRGKAVSGSKPSSRFGAQLEHDSRGFAGQWNDAAGCTQQRFVDSIERGARRWMSEYHVHSRNNRRNAQEFFPWPRTYLDRL